MKKEANTAAGPPLGKAGPREAPAREDNTQAIKAESLFTPSPSAVAGAPALPAAEPAPTPGQSALDTGPLPALGTHVHHYELIRKLGSGGMGTVFLARDIRLGRRVAIKFLHSSNPEITRRFILEARATARCGHENIVIIYEVGEFNGSPFMVLEYLQGQQLNKTVGSQRLAPSRVVELMAPVVRALVCAHGQGIVHRDLKPENILVTDSGTIKVLDFGIAKILQASEGSTEQSSVFRLSQADGASALPGSLNVGEALYEPTRSGSLLGTLSYMSPEQWRGGSDVDHRTDIWAVGIMLFRMLAGRHPLDPLRGTQLAVTGFLDEPMPRLSAVAPEVPAGLAEVVDRCLLKHKEQRFPDAQALLQALEDFLAGAKHKPSGHCPYAGLAAMQEADTDCFFGRAREVATLMRRVHDQPLIAVVGPSGVGKSSLVRAGLVPALKRSGQPWEVLTIRPGRHPLVALANAVAPLVTSSASMADDVRAQEEFIERLRMEPGYIGAVLRSRARRERQQILLVIDQFEECYTQALDAEERLLFAACLSGVADDATSPVRVVLTLRSDALSRAAEDAHFMERLSQCLFVLGPPSREALREALVRPAEAAGYRFETPVLADGMLQSLESAPSAWTVLQLAASELWEQRDASRKLLTEQGYAATGGVGGALASHADRVLAESSPGASELIRMILSALVTPERTRACVLMEDLFALSKGTAELKKLAELLIQSRLVVVKAESAASEATVELSHDSLIHDWSQLQDWLDEASFAKASRVRRRKAVVAASMTGMLAVVAALLVLAPKAGDDKKQASEQREARVRPMEAAALKPTEAVQPPVAQEPPAKDLLVAPEGGTAQTVVAGAALDSESANGEPGKAKHAKLEQRRAQGGRKRVDKPAQAALLRAVVQPREPPEDLQKKQQEEKRPAPEQLDSDDLIETLHGRNR